MGLLGFVTECIARVVKGLIHRSANKKCQSCGMRWYKFNAPMNYHDVVKYDLCGICREKEQVEEVK